MKTERIEKNFPVVCVGGSAGGLDDYNRLLRHLPADKDVGGITIAQKPDTAKQPDMPESAIASGCIDFIISPDRYS